MKYTIAAIDRGTGKKTETIANTSTDEAIDGTPMLFDTREQAENWIEMFGQFINQDFVVEEAR